MPGAEQDDTNPASAGEGNAVLEGQSPSRPVASRKVEGSAGSPQKVGFYIVSLQTSQFFRVRKVEGVRPDVEID